jgi:hypothetical protein
MNEELSKIIDQYTSTANEIALFPTLLSFLVCIIMSFILRSFYITRSFSLIIKTHIGNILPILCLIIFLVIVIIKSSLALSLGLVGALSIVRFRTPIKEPEDLIYLFIAIGMGLGYGSGQILITTTLSLTILLVVYFWLSRNKLQDIVNYNLVLSWKNSDINFKELEKNIYQFTDTFKLIRIEKNNKNNTAVILTTLKKNYSVNDIINELTKSHSDIEVVFFEADNSL